MSFSISSIPKTLFGKINLWYRMQLQAEEAFDNEEKTYTYELCEKEYELYELIQTLGTDFVLDLLEIVEYIPNVATARTAEEAINAIDAHHAVGTE